MRTDAGAGTSLVSDLSSPKRLTWKRQTPDTGFVPMVDGLGAGDRGSQVAAVDAWFLGGPVDGRVMAVEASMSGELPKLVRFTQADVYIGASDIAAPAVEHLYVRAEEVVGWATYQYQQSIEPR